MGNRDQEWVEGGGEIWEQGIVWGTTFSGQGPSFHVLALGRVIMVKV
jgi:hypothetical protein